MRGFWNNLGKFEKKVKKIEFHELFPWVEKKISNCGQEIIFRKFSGISARWYRKVSQSDDKCALI